MHIPLERRLHAHAGQELLALAYDGSAAWGAALSGASLLYQPAMRWYIVVASVPAGSSTGLAALQGIVSQSLPKGCLAGRNAVAVLFSRAR